MPIRWGGGFHEIVPPELLVFTTTAFFDKQGNPMIENLNTVTFEENAGGTKVTLHVVVLRATPEVAGPLAGMKEGWSQSLDKLAELIARTKKIKLQSGLGTKRIPLMEEKQRHE